MKISDGKWCKCCNLWLYWGLLGDGFRRIHAYMQGLSNAWYFANQWIMVTSIWEINWSWRLKVLDLSIWNFILELLKTYKGEVFVLCQCQHYFIRWLVSCEYKWCWEMMQSIKGNNLAMKCEEHLLLRWSFPTYGGWKQQSKEDKIVKRVWFSNEVKVLRE